MGWTRRAGGVDDALDDAPGARADGAQDRADDAENDAESGAEDAPEVQRDNADEGEGGAGEAAEALPGGGRGPAACRARRDDGRRGTSPTALSTVSLSSREPDPPPITWPYRGGQVLDEVVGVGVSAVWVSVAVSSVRAQLSAQVVHVVL